MIKYYNFEVYTESESTGLVRIRTVRATSSEHAERMVERELRKGWRIVGVVRQFKGEDKKWKKEKESRKIKQRSSLCPPLCLSSEAVRFFLLLSSSVN